MPITILVILVIGSLIFGGAMLASYEIRNDSSPIIPFWILVISFLCYVGMIAATIRMASRLHLMKESSNYEEVNETLYRKN